MKKIFSSPLTWGLLTALALGACTDSDSLSNDLEIGTTGAPEDALSFSTYLGQSKKETRAGATGNIDTEVLKGAEYGFGVFAYYTGKKGYANIRRRGTTDSYPNFMYNQMVKYNPASLSEITKWEYSPMKYWPNEVTDDLAEGVDDQVDDADDDPATVTDYTYGGQISFFAYAPYVNVNQETQGNIDGAKPEAVEIQADKSGINAISGNKYKGEQNASVAGIYYSDPYIRYGLPVGSTSKYVDLLWGTKGGTNQNVNNEGNAGVTGNPASSAVYTSTLLEGYTVNANLTKQTTTGTIDFLFKHALAKVGGSYQGNDEGDDDNVNTPTNGLMIVLDLDDEGAEQGGELEPFSPAPNANTKYKTKVTVRDIQISAKMLSEDENDKTPAPADKADYTPTYYKTNEGRLDLATGQWFLEDGSDINGTSKNPSEALTIAHNITSAASTDAVKNAASGALSDSIAEPASVAKTAADFCNILPLGVTTVPKNVYAEETNALVFFPGTYPQLTITIDYIVRTYDENLGDAFSEVGQKITKTLTFDDAVELNKQYNILIHLGLTSVKFTATVDDWDAGTTTTTTTDENGDPVDITETEVHHDVYNPRNVQNPTTGLTVSAAAGTNIAAMSDNGDIIVKSTAADATKLSVQAAYTTTGNPTGNVTNNASYTSDADWVTVDAQGNVTIAENNTYASTARTATITVTYDGKTQDITVKQYSKNITELTTATGLTTAVTATTTAASGSYTLGVDPIGNASIKATIATYDENGNVVDTEPEKVGKKAVISAVEVKDASNNDVANQATFSGNVLQYKENTSSSVYTYTVTVQYMGKTADFTFNQAAATPACAAAHFVYTNATAGSNAYTYKGSISSSPTSEEVKYSITRAQANKKTDGTTFDILADISRYLGALYRMDGTTVTSVEYNGTTYTWNDGLNLKGSNWANTSATPPTLVQALANTPELVALLSSSSGTTLTFNLNGGKSVIVKVTIK